MSLPSLLSRLLLPLILTALANSNFVFVCSVLRNCQNTLMTFLPLCSCHLLHPAFWLLSLSSSAKQNKTKKQETNKQKQISPAEKWPSQRIPHLSGLPLYEVVISQILAALAFSLCFQTDCVCVCFMWILVAVSEMCYSIIA